MNKNQYVTTSLALAAAIQLASQSKLLFVEKTSTRQSSFILSESPNLQNIVEKFWGKELSLDAFSYFEALRYIKARLYQEGEA